jgi:hypothetical protein
MIRPCTDADFDTIFAIINDAAQAYCGVIPADCWHVPYMSKEYLRHEIDSGVRFWGWEEGGELVGIKGEIGAEFSDVPQQCVLNADPSYLRTVNKLGAFFAWTRGGYYFSAHAKMGGADLDAFMQAFPW